MNENDIPGMADGPLTTEPIVVWRKSAQSNGASMCVEVAAITTDRG